MWLACHTQEEIAAACDVTQPTVNSVAEDFIKIVLENQTYKAASQHLTDFDPPLYNVWKQQTKTPGSSHFGIKRCTMAGSMKDRKPPAARNCGT
jgi:hypothetical protein